MAGRPWVGMAKPSLETRLVEAVRSGDAASVNHLLNKGVNLNAVVASGDTAIGVAAQNGDVTILRLLLDFNRYSSQRTAEKNTRHSDSTCVYGRTTKGNDYCKRTCHSDSVFRYDDSDTNNCCSSKDKSRCHSDVTYVYDRSSTRTLHVETACDPIANTNRAQRTSHIDTQYVNCDSAIFKTNKDKNMFYSDAACVYKGNENKRTDHSDVVACHGSSSNVVKIADKTRCHSDAVDNVRTTSSSDKNNCGYFVVYHEDACEQDENENCNLEGRTPEGMDQLEWDVRDGEEGGEEKEADVWSCQYRWYADILDKTRCEEEEQRTCRLLPSRAR
ncbi:hypothetical protein LSTR_LSTR013657 [Laodelphax striatellus]|uniref:Uncharacterized protein n=1 Tax=Laodelphax striatellus TaxID=195883 RepID=A0A482WSR3_LAOST|nr:hypothetical protein LSTR_LSTR013657 [Laodelphax striatellus]